MNLIPQPEKWFSFYPQNLTSPEFDNSGELSINLPKSEYSLGKWICNVSILPNKTYTLKATAITSATPLDAWVIISTHKGSGGMEIREHAKVIKYDDGKIDFSITFETGEDIVSTKVELWLKGKNLFAKWNNISLSEAQPLPPRNVSICMTYISPHIKEEKTLENNLNNMLKAIDNAAKYSPDIVVLSEGMYHRESNIKIAEHAESADGEISKIFAQKAKEIKSYLVYNFHERVNNLFYNTSLLFDRNGNQVGKYRKTHLTVSELEKGIVPGDELPVFETDFGKIGLLTCWDQYFPQTTEELVKKGAEIIFVPTAGDAAQKSFARAMDNGIYFATSGVNGTVNGEDDYGWCPSRIISPLGNLLAQTDTHLDSAHCVIDLNKKERSFWLSVGPAKTDSTGCYMFEKNTNIK